MDDSSPGAPRSAAIRGLLGPIRQIGYVVPDVEAAAWDWVNRLGVGPWRVKHGLTLDDCRNQGESIQLELSIASSYSTGVEVELISQRSGPASIYTDFLAGSGPGAQHVCFFPDDYDAAIDGLRGDGLEVVFDGAIGRTRFAYLSDGRGQVIEIADVSEAGLAARSARSAAAAEWDGSDPVRVS